MGHMSNGAYWQWVHRGQWGTGVIWTGTMGYRVCSTGVWGTWAMGHIGNGVQRTWGTWAMGYGGNGVQKVWSTWAMGHRGNGVPPRVNI